MIYEERLEELIMFGRRLKYGSRIQIFEEYKSQGERLIVLGSK